MFYFISNFIPNVSVNDLKFLAQNKSVNFFFTIRMNEQNNTESDFNVYKNLN